MSLKMWFSIIAASIAVLAAEFDRCSFRRRDSSGRSEKNAEKIRSVRKNEERQTYNLQKTITAYPSTHKMEIGK